MQKDASEGFSASCRSFDVNLFSSMFAGSDALRQGYADANFLFLMSIDASDALHLSSAVNFLFLMSAEL